jgi:hypothetical protein
MWLLRRVDVAEADERSAEVGEIVGACRRRRRVSASSALRFS